MKRMWVLLVLACLAWPSATAWALGQKFTEEPYVDLMSSKTVGQNQFRGYVQHEFQNWNIESMNYRIGYGILPGWDIYATGLFHMIHLWWDAEASAESIHEYEADTLISFMNEGNEQPIDLALFGGFNRSTSFIMFPTGSGTTYQSWFMAQLLASKTIADFLFVTAAPTWIYHQDNQQTIWGLLLGLKIFWNDNIALVADYPVQLNNPENWKQPWSAGIQFHTGPHTWTLFISDVYGFTIPNLLQGLGPDYFFAGFRFSF